MTDQNKPIYVYVLTDPRYPDDVRYVGVTNTPKKRLRGHISKAKIQTNHRANWIKSLLRDGLEPIMTIIAQTDNENWRQCEMEWIAYYRDIGCNLVNSTDGGEGTRGFIPNEETRRKLSKAQLNKPPLSEEQRHKASEKQRGKKYSDESRRKMSESQRNRPPITDESRRRMSEASRNHSKESFRKIGDSNRGRKRTEETRRLMIENNTRRRAILQYDKFGNFIQKWDGVINASKSLSIQSAHIVACCKYKRKSAYGYVWRYADDPLLGEYPVQLPIDFDE